MKPSRLEELYNRRLVSPENAGRRFPLEHTLKKKLEYFPARPEIPDYNILEIGPGAGDFLIHLGSTHPQKKILGIEISGSRCVRIRERILKRDLKNITLIHGDARLALHKDLHSARFESIFVLFPDPWPKNRQAHNRLLSHEFLSILIPTLARGGTITLATDVVDYATWAATNMARFPELKNGKQESLEAANAADLIPTGFEKKWRALGRSCHLVRFEKALE